MLPNTFNLLCHHLIWSQFFPLSVLPPNFLLLDDLATGIVELISFFLPTSETLFSLFRRKAGCYAPHGWGNLLFLSVSPSPPPVFLWIKESFVNTLSACQKELMHNARFVVCLIQKNWLANEGKKKKLWDWEENSKIGCWAKYFNSREFLRGSARQGRDIRWRRNLCGAFVITKNKQPPLQNESSEEQKAGQAQKPLKCC